MGRGERQSKKGRVFTKIIPASGGMVRRRNPRLSRRFAPYRCLLRHQACAGRRRNPMSRRLPSLDTWRRRPRRTDQVEDDLVMEGRHRSQVPGQRQATRHEGLDAERLETGEALPGSRTSPLRSTTTERCARRPPPRRTSARDVIETSMRPSTWMTERVARRPCEGSSFFFLLGRRPVVAAHGEGADVDLVARTGALPASVLTQ